MAGWAEAPPALAFRGCQEPRSRVLPALRTVPVEALRVRCGCHRGVTLMVRRTGKKTGYNAGGGILTVWTIEYRNVLVHTQMVKQSNVTSTKKVTSIQTGTSGAYPLWELDLLASCGGWGCWPLFCTFHGLLPIRGGELADGTGASERDIKRACAPRTHASPSPHSRMLW